MDYNEIKEQHDSALDRWRKFRSSVDSKWDWNRPYKEYADVLYNSMEYHELKDWTAKEICMRKVYTLRDPKDWEKDLVIPIKDFMEACHHGMFTDNDGDGYFGTGSLITDIEVWPSVLLKAEDMKILPSNFTHIWWYNK